MRARPGRTSKPLGAITAPARSVVAAASAVVSSAAMKMATPSATRRQPFGAAASADALARFFREACRGRGELLVALEKRSLLVAEAQLVALPNEMRAFRLDAGGPRFGEGDARARRLLLRGAGAVGGVARAARRDRGFFIDARAPVAKVRELRRERGKGGPGALVLGPNGREARFEAGDAFARRRFNRCRVRRADAAQLFLLPCRAQILVRPGGRRLALGDVVGQAIDLLVDARDLRREIGALVGRRPERGLVPAQGATA